MKYPYSLIPGRAKRLFSLAVFFLIAIALSVLFLKSAKAQDTLRLESFDEQGNGHRHEIVEKKKHKRNIVTRTLYGEDDVQPAPVDLTGCKVKTVWQTPETKVWLTIGSDGYTYADSAKFFNVDVPKFVTALFADPAIGKWKNKFGVKAMFGPSVQPGASGIECYTGGAAVTVNNRYGSTFNRGGTCRLLYPTNITQFVSDAQALTPGYHKGLLIVNSTYYGGGGGAVATFSTHAQSAEIGIHEFGHSMFGLGDEYAGAGCSTFSGPINVARNEAEALQKWGSLYTYIRWGAYYSTTCHGRCFDNCKMRNLGQPFCPVCVKEIDRIMTSLAGTITQHEPTCTHVGEFTPSVGSIKWKITKGSEYKGKGVMYTVTRTSSTGATYTQKIDFPFYIGQRSGGWNSTTTFTSGSKWNIKISDPSGCVKEYNVIIP